MILNVNTECSKSHPPLTYIWNGWHSHMSFVNIFMKTQSRFWMTGSNPYCLINKTNFLRPLHDYMWAWIPLHTIIVRIICCTASIYYPTHPVIRAGSQTPISLIKLSAHGDTLYCLRKMMSVFQCLKYCIVFA